MKYSVVLQDPFDYARMWLLIGLGLILAAALVWLARYFLSGKDFRVNWKKLPVIRSIRLFFRKRRHTKRIRQIETEFGKGTIDRRTAHQKMSREVRAFAQAVTGEPMESLVYTELLRMNYPKLTRLIGEFYVPEFACKSDAEIKDMIQKSKELIKKWR